MEALETTRAALDAAGARQMLTFALGGEEYAVDILKVQEIQRFVPITPVPHAPSHIKGVLNLRGALVPVVDLRDKFGMSTGAYDRFTVIVIVRVLGRSIGLVVDAVSDVLTLRPEDVGATPDLGTSVDTSFIAGLGRSGERLIILLDIERVLASDSLVSLDAVA